MNKDEQTLSISVQNAGIVKEPVAGTDVTEPEAETASDVNLVGSFTKIGGKDNKGLDKTTTSLVRISSGVSLTWMMAMAWASNRCVHTSILPMNIWQEQPC